MSGRQQWCHAAIIPDEPVWPHVWRCASKRHWWSCHSFIKFFFFFSTHWNQTVHGTLVLLLKCCRTTKLSVHRFGLFSVYVQQQQFSALKILLLHRWPLPLVSLAVCLPLSLAVAPLKSRWLIPDVEHARYLRGVGNTLASLSSCVYNSYILLQCRHVRGWDTASLIIASCRRGY